MAGSCCRVEPGNHEELRIGSNEDGADPLEAVHATIASVKCDLGSKIAELEKRLKLLEESSGGSDKDPDLRGGENAPEPESDDSQAVYELTVSIWDAGLLLFIQKNNLHEKFVLVMGVVLNLWLQIFVYFVVVYNLIDNDFSDATILEMVNWRVQNGHHGDNFNVPVGKSYSAQLCAHQLWSFEGQEYADMYSYLYRPIPGAYLSILAIILWVLDIMSEYRKSVSQVLSLAHLPRARLWEECLAEDPSGDLHVRGIGTFGRLAAVLFLGLPRLAIAVALMIVGCKYLAQTVTLSDIVLNTVALAFVTDVDEFIGEVFLTERLQAAIGKIQPLKCGKPSTPHFHVRDLVRYTVIVGMVVFAVVYWLLPFNESVTAAAMALCGGELHFSYSGGTKIQPDITLMPATRIFDEYRATCPADFNRTYQGVYYPEYSPPGENSSAAPDGGGGGGSAAPDGGDGGGANQTVEELLVQEVMQYAFSSDGCGPGMVRRPPVDTSSDNKSFFERIFADEGQRRQVRGTSPATSEGSGCAPLPAPLRWVLPSGVRPGEGPGVRECQRFDASLRGGACEEPEHPGVCVWGWEAQACEGMESPGVLFQDACRSSLWRACETWEAGFNLSHPTKNCEITRYCSPAHPRCLGMDGWVDIPVGNASAFAGWEEGLRMAAAAAFGSAVSVPDPWINAHFFVVLAGSPVYQDFVRAGSNESSEAEGECIDLQTQSEITGLAYSVFEMCGSYTMFQEECGRHDTDRFAARAACCVCGGGIRREQYATGCMQQGAECILVFYRLIGMSEYLRREDVISRNATIAGYMTFAPLLFNEASFRYFATPPLGPPPGYTEEDFNLEIVPR